MVLGRLARILLLLSICGIFGGVLKSLPAVALSDSGEGAQTASLINQERSAHGLNQLEIYWDLVDDARAQTDRMIQQGEIYHNPGLASVTTGWYSLGENVGVGPNSSRLHLAFMNSAPHRANILGKYNYMGVGAERDADGNLFVTVVFMDGPPGLVSPVSTTTSTTAPQATTTTSTISTTTTTPASTTTSTTVALSQTTTPTTALPQGTTNTKAEPSASVAGFAVAGPMVCGNDVANVKIPIPVCAL